MCKNGFCDTFQEPLIDVNFCFRLKLCQNWNRYPPKKSPRATLTLKHIDSKVRSICLPLADNFRENKRISEWFEQVGQDKLNKTKMYASISQPATTTTTKPRLSLKMLLIWNFLFGFLRAFAHEYFACFYHETASWWWTISFSCVELCCGAFFQSYFSPFCFVSFRL